MALRVVALAFWLWLLIQLFPAEDFGWLSSVLAVCTICSLLAQAGIPFLFFSDQHSIRSTEQRWRQALGAILGLAPIITLLGSTIIPRSTTPLPLVAIYIFMLCEVLLSAFVQIIALKGHAAGYLRMATALPALLAVARMGGAITLFILPFRRDSEVDPLFIYLLIHVSLMTLGACFAFIYARRHISLPLSPQLASTKCVRETWRYAAMGGASLATSELDKPLSAHMLGLTTSGHYSAAYRMCSMLATPATAFAASLLPRWAAMNSKRESKQLIGSFWRALAIVAVTGSCLSVMLQLLIGWFVEHIDLGFYPETWPWLYSLSWLVPLLGAHQITSAGLLSIGRPLSRAVIDLLAFAAFASTLALLLSHTENWALPAACLVAEMTAITAGAMTFTLTTPKTKASRSTR